MGKVQQNKQLGATTTKTDSVRLDVNRLVHGKVRKNFKWLHENFHTQEVSMEELASIIQAGHAYTSPFAKVRDDTHATCHYKANVTEVPLLWLDAESEDERSTSEYWLNEPLVRDYGAIVHTTSSHTPDKPRSRVLFRLKNPLNVEDAETALKALFWHYSHVDQDVHDAGRVLYGAPGCEMEVLDHVLPLDVLNERIVEPYLAHLKAEERRLEEARQDVLASIKRTPGPIDASQVANYVKGSKDAILDDLERAVEGTGKRHKRLKSGSVRLFSLQKARWLDDEARLQLATIKNDILDATRKNGYLDKYGEGDVLRHIETGERLAQPANEPVWKEGDFFAPGDFVVATVPGRQASGSVSAVKKDKDGWLYKVNGAWWPQCALEHDDDATEEENASGYTNNVEVEPKQASKSALSEEMPAPPANWDDPPPDKPPPRELPEVDEEDELVSAFFQKVKGVQCTCRNKGSYIDIYLKRTGIHPNSNNDRRECPYHRHKNAYRFTRQVEVEQKQKQLTLSRFGSIEDWTRTRKKWNKRHERGQDNVAFRPFFQEDGSVAVIHSGDTPGAELPEDTVDLLDVVTDILANEHESKRSRASKGFGGSYCGTRGNSNKDDGEKYALQCNVSASRLAQEAFEVKTNTFGHANIERDCVTVFCNLSDFRAEERQKGHDIELEERWPQGMENEVARTIYSDELVKEVLAEYNEPDDANAYSVEMSSLTHNTTNTILCNKGDIPEVEEQLTLEYMTTSTSENAVLEPAERPPPATGPPEVILALPGQETRTV